MMTERGQPRTETWTEFNQALEMLTAELKSESAAEDSVADVVTPRADRDNDGSESGAARADNHNIETNDDSAVNPNQEAPLLALTARCGRSWSKPIIAEPPASAVGRRRSDPNRAARTRSFKVAGVALLVAITAANAGVAYLTWWPEYQAASAAHSKQGGIIADAALYADEALDMKAISGQAGALSDAPTARVMPVRVVGWSPDAAPIDAADAPWRRQSSAAPDGEAQTSKPAPEKPAAMSASEAAALASVEESAGTEMLPAGAGRADTLVEGPITLQIDEHDISALLARANSMVQSGDIASARLVFEQVADTGDAYAAGTSYSSAVISRLPVLAMVLNDAAVPPDAFGSPQEAAVPAQITPRQRPVSGSQAILESSKEGKERRPGKREDQPRAQADGARPGPVVFARRIVRTVADRVTRGLGL